MGASPAIAGLALGMSSILWTGGTFGAGRMMVRSSYRAPAILGGVIMMIGSILLLTAQPSYGVLWVASAAGILGLGMGLSNTVFLIAVQTAVGWSDRGAATSANMFLRTIGQSVGTAVFGAVFNLVVGQRVVGASDEINRLLEPSTRDTLAPDDVARLSDAIGAAMHNVYWIASVCAVVLFVLAFRIPAGLRPGGTVSEAPRPAASD
jgi:MFS family permease